MEEIASTAMIEATLFLVLRLIWSWKIKIEKIY